ncbi:hypothetical protein L0V05_17540 [Tabrizicola sp. J26]|uniref:BTAD domain-containing putative transcriptional regulator n=1 Tax=Alitabrizicola rongguiensis TaxID=2909234 RepID=UPI001F45421E|nr:BTAD domain-containing putative transcriptional regulator [Tabrizicola rongguiensis]MCF1710614.1 hypothetical protein [Tabrizicola rongguiensis]
MTDRSNTPDASPPRSSLSFRVFDSFELLLNGEVVPLRPTKAKAIVAWFCLSGQSRISRSRLASLLWSGANEENSRGSLRNILYVLRDNPPVPGMDPIVSDRETVIWTLDRLPNEVAVALSALDQGDERPLRSLSLAEADLRFATDLFGLDPEFETFLRSQRDPFIAAMADALRARLQPTNQSESSRVVAEKLRELVPHDETATRHLMLLDIAAGNSAAALEHYNRLWALLDEEFDVEPSEATQALAVRIKSQGTVQAPPPQPLLSLAPAQDRITVYLRPIAGDMMSDDNRIVVNGMQAEIVSSLLTVGDWIVIEADNDTPLPTMRGNFELRGVFSPGIGEMRVILTLKDTSSGRIIWTTALPLNRGDWIRNSELAVQRLASHLIGKVESHYVTNLDSLGDGDLPDYDKLVRARWLMNDWSPDSDRRAEALMRSVTTKGEVGLRARVMLAELLNSRSVVFPGLYAPREGVAEAYEIAEGCVRDDILRSDAWLALAWSSVQSGRFGRAIEAADEAALGSQSSPRRIASTAEVLALSGQTERAARLSAAVNVLDPGINRATLGYRVSIALLSGDYDGCVSYAQKSDNIIVFGYGYAAAAAELAGKPDIAKGCWDRFKSDLRRRWHGKSEPDALQWFASATPLSPEAGLNRVIDAIARIA